MANNKKNKNNSNNKQDIKKGSSKNGEAFNRFMSKKPARIAFNTITIIIWIAFLTDFFTYKNTKGYPNPLLSLIALVTLLLGYSYYNGKKINKK